MDVASDRELEEIQSLRKLINDVNNGMPEPTVNCPEEGCGRKFKNKDCQKTSCGDIFIYTEPSSVT